MFGVSFLYVCELWYYKLLNKDLTRTFNSTRVRLKTLLLGLQKLQLLYISKQAHLTTPVINSKGLHLCRAFIQSALQGFCHSFIHLHTHNQNLMAASFHTVTGYIWVQCLAFGHLDTLKGRGGDWITNSVISSLPPQSQLSSAIVIHCSDNLSTQYCHLHI